MPESGQTILQVDQVGFQRLPDVTPHDPMSGAPLIGQREQQYAILLQDTENNRIWVAPISENVRKILVEAMRKAPLEVVTALGDEVQVRAPFAT
jgi:hypothetical protein